MNSIILSPRFSFQDNTSNSYQLAKTSASEEYELPFLLNNSTNNNNTAGNGYNFNNDLLYRHKFKTKGRTLSLNLGTTLTNRNRDAFTKTESIYYQAGQVNDSLDQFSNNLSNGVTVSSNVVYTEPIGKNSQLQLNYNLSWSENKNDKKTFGYASDQKDYTLPDTSLTNIFDNGYVTHRAGLGYLYQTDKMNLNAGITYQKATLSGKTTFPFRDSTDQSFDNVLPNLMFNYKFTKTTNLRVTYRVNSSSPSVTQMQNVIDNSNPLLLSTGNPGLKQEIRHFSYTRFSHSNAGKTANVFGVLFFQKTFNYIGNATIIASGDLDTVINNQHIQLKRGSQLTIPRNLDGAWNIRSLLTIGFPVKQIKSNINFNTGVSYNRLPSLINGNTNESNTYGLNLGTVISSNISEKLDFTITYNLNYNLVENSIQPQLNSNYLYHIGSLQLNWEFWKGFFFQNSVTYQNYKGLSSSFSDEYSLWNFNLGKRLFKNKAGEIKLSCYDILDQNQSINRSVTDTYIEDSSTQILKQYFMLSFTYNLRKFNGKMPDMEKDRFRPGHEGRPDGPPHMH
jgi:hypothetical protein